jgi:branched-subunit amino acid ABC-type transport system permease component/ABC-type branched-subunit amino acid transport system ATPase component
VDKFLNLVASGLVTGAIYSIMASGLVLTYTTSGIFNFAHGAIAFTTAYLYYQLNTGLGIPIVPAVVISVFIFAPLLGLLLDRILLRRLAKAPVYARIVGTIGLLVALPALVQWIVQTVGIEVLGWDLPGSEAVVQGAPVPGIGPTPAVVYHPLNGVTFDSDRLAVFVVAAIAAVVLWLIIRHSRVGLEMRAVVDRDTLAGLRGVNPARTSAIAWILTMMLAGFGGILIAPLFSLQDTFYAVIVLGSLAAVVLGGLRSIPIAFAGGLALGVVQNLVAGYRGDVLPPWINAINGLQFSVPYVLVIILLFVFGRDRSRRAGSVAEDTPSPDHREGLPTWRRVLPWAIFVVALIAYSQQWINVPWLQADTFDQSVIAQSLVMGIIFLSFVVVTGLGGMVSLAQWTFMTAGGFAAGWALTWDLGFDLPMVASHGSINFLWAAIIGTIVAAALGAFIAMLATRLGGVMLALGTLAAAFIFASIVFEVDTIRNYSDIGWSIRSPTLDIPVVNWVNDLVVQGDQPKLDFAQLPEQILLFLAVFGIVTALIHALWRSASGRAMLAARSSEVAAQSAGIRVNRTKIMIFALAAGIAGFGGVMLGTFQFSIGGTNPSYLGVYVGLFWLAVAVLFGIRRPGGALLAGFAVAAGTPIFHWIASDILPGGDVNTLVTSVYFVPILSGLGAINLAQEPDGILSLVGQRRLEKQREKRRLERLVAAEAAAHGGEVPEHEVVHVAPVAPVAAVSAAGGALEGAAFAARGVVAGYGDAEVLHGVDLRLDAGKVTALLGANGAGKSTLCSVAAGLVAPTFGTLLLDGADITKSSTYQRARSGILLVPEARGIFPGLTVEENLTVLLRDPALREKAYERFPILAQRRKQVAGLLSGGEQQMLSLAPALAQPPTVLIADEPTLGLAPLAAEAVMQAILELRDAGSAVLLVEEHAQNALQVADTLAFMELGAIVWIGPREEADMDLLTSAYLGSSSH